jgi:hypothetical protein
MKYHTMIAAGLLCGQVEETLSDKVSSIEGLLLEKDITLDSAGFAPRHVPPFVITRSPGSIQAHLKQATKARTWELNPPKDNGGTSEKQALYTPGTKLSKRGDERKSKKNAYQDKQDLSDRKETGGDGSLSNLLDSLSSLSSRLVSLMKDLQATGHDSPKKEKKDCNCKKKKKKTTGTDNSNTISNSGNRDITSGGNAGDSNTSGKSGVDSNVNQMVCMVNSLRKSQGKKPLKISL